eukprot:CAMPEP_0198298770 /NCGR_PEP_ID=MMETSP1449-20131203/42064_1 /TAXON_ID=420275 /ORGANISM="Attheya septentrionalis, Strain CCMP2084" /LENGTH=77 /DNA_ID=CAMNT_0044000127 /DNA_START=67 /DNA_END=300 /DNA_ORIENTATION=-
MQRATRTFSASAMKEEKSKSISKSVWLADPGAYPVMFVVVFACSLCATVGVRTLMTNTDVRVDRSKRQSVIRTWGRE